MARKPKVYEGGCLCGHIRFTAQGPALDPHTCSCKMCQRHTGALTSVWVVFPKPSVAWTGPGGAPAVWRASAISSRAFCPVCGSTLGAIDDAPTVGLLVGAFDRNGGRELVPQHHSYKGGRPKWWRVEAADD
jgi:hypothetical protein